jgi:hypothetical protein
LQVNNHIQRAKKLTVLLDTKFSILGFKFGLDPILSILPWLGTAIGALTSTYVFWIANKLSVPTSIYLKMALNILLDFLLGGIPLIGFIFDAFYKSNTRNIKILEKHIQSKSSIK